jgi:hypothetical protein
MVYTRLFVLVHAFYTWAYEEYGVTPKCLGIDDLYIEITKLCKQRQSGEMKQNIDGIKAIHDMGKVSCYAPSPWGLSAIEVVGFKDMIAKYVNESIKELESKPHVKWGVCKSRDWWNLFVQNYNLDDDKACKL